MPNDRSPKKPLVVKLEARQLDEFKAACAFERTTMAGAIREFVQKKIAESEFRIHVSQHEGCYNTKPPKPDLG